LATTETTQESLEEFRLSRFLDMSFTWEEAKQLAEGKDSDGWPICTHHVQGLLEKGCPHQLVMRIVL
jgi:hypothetical protein